MSILSAIGHYFEGLFKGLFGQLKTSVVTFLESFVKTDLGALAGDAVAYVESALPGTAETDTAKRDAAKAKFIADAKTAGHDISAFGESILNFLIETAYQAFQAGLVALPTVVAPIITATGL